MKDFIIPVNNEALSRALVAVAGEDTAKLIVQAYQAIDQAMVFGYERGLAAAALASKEEKDAAMSGSYDAGYDTGLRDGHEEMEQRGFDANDQEAYEDGYVAGVSDARARPQVADEEMERLCAAEGFYETFDEGGPYNETNVSDSGDEHDFWRDNALSTGF
jgi:hypothetical protein